MIVEIDQALLHGEPFRHIASRFGTNTGTLQRHKAAHISQTLAKAKDAAEVIKADNLLASIRTLHARALGILKKAEEAGQLMVALAAIREAARLVELQGKLLGQLNGQDGGDVHITVNYVDRAIIAPNRPPQRLVGSAQPDRCGDGGAL